MYQLFGWKTWCLLGAWIVLLIGFILSYFPTINLPIRVVAGIAVAFPSLFFVDTVWRFVWKKIPILNSWIFPDLNGEWDVVISSNWPIQEKLLNASKSKKVQFNPCSSEQVEELSDFALKAKITQNWLRFHVRLWSEVNGVIDESNSLCVIPRKLETDDHGFKLYYMYDQSSIVSHSYDENSHLGSAVLTITGEPWDKIKGFYWTNRSWQKGINTAGRITFKKSDQSS